MDEYVIENFNKLPLLNKSDIVRKHARFIHAQQEHRGDAYEVFRIALYVLDQEFVEVTCNSKYQIVGVWMCDYQDLNYHINNIEINYAFNFK